MRHLVRLDLGNSEVGNLRDHPLVDHHVRRLDVAMNDAALMGVIERSGGLLNDADDELRIRRSRVQQPLQRWSVYKLHRDIGDVVLFQHVVDGDDVRV